MARGDARAKAAVAKIRARGGEVVFVRPPSAPRLRVNEEAQVPRAKGWDVLVAQHPQRLGFHADDLPLAQNLTLPEWSHLNSQMRASCSPTRTSAASPSRRHCINFAPAPRPR